MRLVAYELQGGRYSAPLKDPVRVGSRTFMARLKVEREGKPVYRASDPSHDMLTQKVVDGAESEDADKIIQTRVAVARSADEKAEAAEAFAAYKTAMKLRVDQDAELARQEFVTPGDAQQAVYQLKKAEAEAMASDGNPQVANYPLLAQEVGITAGTLPAVGVSVRAQAAAWIAVAATIEGLRLGAKKTIDEATTFAAVDAAAAGIAWPSPG